MKFGYCAEPTPEFTECRPPSRLTPRRRVGPSRFGGWPVSDLYFFPAQAHVDALAGVVHRMLDEQPPGEEAAVNVENVRDELSWAYTADNGYCAAKALERYGRWLAGEKSVPGRGRSAPGGRCAAAGRRRARYGIPAMWFLQHFGRARKGHVLHGRAQRHRVGRVRPDVRGVHDAVGVRGGEKVGGFRPRVFAEPDAANQVSFGEVDERDRRPKVRERRPIFDLSGRRYIIG